MQASILFLKPCFHVNLLSLVPGFSFQFPVCLPLNMQINKDLGRMKRFNAQEALEYGLIDRIVRPPRIKADAPRKDETSGLG